MFCECGCGQLTKLSDRDRPRDGYMKGEPRRFVPGHHCKKAETARGYRTYHRRRIGVHQTLHRAVAEKALGKSLPPGAEVHHVDSSNLDTSALVICQDIRYHRLLHVRARVLRAGGNPNTDRICGWCKQVRLITDMVKSGQSSPTTCKACHAKRERDKRARKLGVIAQPAPVAVGA